jgi:hypothetical protein
MLPTADTLRIEGQGQRNSQNHQNHQNNLMITSLERLRAAQGLSQQNSFTGMPKIMLNYRQNGQRRLERHLKRLLDEAETGISKSNS